jgi:hypothetical protein
MDSEFGLLRTFYTLGGNTFRGECWRQTWNQRLLNRYVAERTTTGIDRLLSSVKQGPELQHEEQEQ